MLLAKTLSYYKRRDVESAILSYAQNKEIAVRFSDYFGKRPDTLVYEEDVLEFAKKKATSFHCSEELWSNPLSLRSEIKKQEMDELRIGWDLILDIDCHHFDYSKFAAHYLAVMLKDLGVSSVTCKFSGNKGFHLAVPFESFPSQIKGIPTRNLFPEAPRKIAYYLRDNLKPLLKNKIMDFEKGDVSNVVKRTGMNYNDIVSPEKNDEGYETLVLDVEKFLEIDTILIAPRHLYRMPYSLHEKSLLVSVPVDVNKILEFEKESAEVNNIVFDIPFLDRKLAVAGEAQNLFINAFDFYPDEKEKDREVKQYTMPEEAIPEEYFPPCIKLMLQGLEDGKKRSLFTMINFFKGAGWDMSAIDQKMHDWNKKNPEALREVILKGQLYQAKKTKDIVPPHNCKSYYQDLRVCAPDGFCAKIRNPLQYAKNRAEQNKKKKGMPRLSEEQKEMRRKFREKKKAEINVNVEPN